MNYAVSNIICAIVYGSRFEYDDPKFMAMVNRANENIRLAGSASVQVTMMTFTMVFSCLLLCSRTFCEMLSHSDSEDHSTELLMKMSFLDLASESAFLQSIMIATFLWKHHDRNFA